jgi:hypothetical protein
MCKGLIHFRSILQIHNLTLKGGGGVLKSDLLRIQANPSLSGLCPISGPHAIYLFIFKCGNASVAAKIHNFEGLSDMRVDCQL